MITSRNLYSVTDHISVNRVKSGRTRRRRPPAPSSFSPSRLGRSRRTAWRCGTRVAGFSVGTWRPEARATPGARWAARRPPRRCRALRAAARTSRCARSATTARRHVARRRDALQRRRTPRCDHHLLRPSFPLMNAEARRSSPRGIFERERTDATRPHYYPSH